MRRAKRGVLTQILLERANLIEILVIAFITALGINLIANGLVLFSGFSPLIALILGTGLCLVSILYLAVRVLGRRARSHIYTGFFIYNEKKNELIRVPRYEFSEDLSMYIDAAFFENKALKLIWDKEPLKNTFKNDPEAKKTTRRNVRACQLICEAAEYFVLSTLSVHLTDYFEHGKFREENLRKFERNDVPDVLLKNRFLELFSRPMENRSHFVKDTFAKENHEETVAVYSKGAIYERFDLVLPKGSIVRRLGENKIEIETQRFVIGIAVRFEGFSALLPRNFEKYYLSLEESRKDIAPYEVHIEIKVLFKFGRLLSRTGWEYYQWIDSFLGKLDEGISKRRFFKLIGWDSAATVIECLKALIETKVPENGFEKRA